MAHRIVLVGHCGPDSSFLRIAAKRAAPHAEITAAHDAASLKAEIERGASLLLINRVLEYGFDTEHGVELIQRVVAQSPAVKTMLVSNFPEAQAAAVAAGALPGFGKSELNQPHVMRNIAAALEP